MKYKVEYIFTQISVGVGISEIIFYHMWVYILELNTFEYFEYIRNELILSVKKPLNGTETVHTQRMKTELQ